MRCSFVSTVSSLLCMACISLLRCCCCSGLSSSGVTQPQRDYTTVRLPASLQLILTLLSLVSIYSLSLRDSAGYPQWPFIPNVQHAIVIHPGEVIQHLPCALYPVGFQLVNIVALLIRRLSRLNPFSLRLRPAALFPLRSIFGITPADPEFSIRWLACLSGVGLTPTGLNDLARPH